MLVHVTCSRCGKSYKVDGKFAGRTVKCAACGAPIAILAGQSTPPQSSSDASPWQQFSAAELGAPRSGPPAPPGASPFGLSDSPPSRIGPPIAAAPSMAHPVPGRADYLIPFGIHPWGVLLLLAGLFVVLSGLIGLQTVALPEGMDQPIWWNDGPNQFTSHCLWIGAGMILLGLWLLASGWRSPEPNRAKLITTLALLGAACVLSLVLWPACYAGSETAMVVAFVLFGVAGAATFIVGKVWALGLMIKDDGVVALILLILVPFYDLYYVITRWDRQAKPMVFALTAFPLIVLGGAIVSVGGARERQVYIAQQLAKRAQPAVTSQHRTPRAAPPPARPVSQPTTAPNTMAPTQPRHAATPTPTPAPAPTPTAHVNRTQPAKVVALGSKLPDRLEDAPDWQTGSSTQFGGWLRIGSRYMMRIPAGARIKVERDGQHISVSTDHQGTLSVFVFKRRTFNTAWPLVTQVTGTDHIDIRYGRFGQWPATRRRIGRSLGYSIYCDGDAVSIGAVPTDPKWEEMWETAMRTFRLFADDPAARRDDEPASTAEPMPPVEPTTNTVTAPSVPGSPVVAAPQPERPAVNADLTGLPTWRPADDQLAQLGPEVRIGAYAIRPPRRFDMAEVTDDLGRWLGRIGYAHFMEFRVAISTRDHMDMPWPPEAPPVGDASTESITRTVEHGAINGIGFVFDQQQVGRANAGTRSFQYTGYDGRYRIQITGQCPGNMAEHLDAMNAAARTFRRAQP